MKTARAGTTLLELMIAITLSGIILSAGYGIADQISRTTTDDPAVKAAFEAAELRRHLSSWFGNLLVEMNTTVYPFTGTSVPTAQIQTLLGAALPHTPTAVIGKLFVDTDSGTATEGLIIQLSDPIDRTARQIALHRDVGSMKIRYLVGTSGAAQWTDMYTSSAEPPRAIEITLVPRVGARLHRLLELPIVIPVGLQ